MSSVSNCLFVVLEKCGYYNELVGLKISKLLCLNLMSFFSHYVVLFGLFY